MPENLSLGGGGGGGTNNKGADQPAHSHSVIRAFVIPLLESIISRLSMREFLIFWLVSVAEQAVWYDPIRKPEDRFSCVSAHLSVVTT